MTKKRKIKSTLPSEPKPQFLRALVVVALAVVLAVGLGAVSTAQAATINVPADYDTIQEAVDAATSGDTIIVAPGEYAGAGILKTVKIVGSGTGTRITTGIPLSPTFPYGDAFDILYADAAGTEISNLEIEVPPSTSWTSGIVMAFADNCTVKDVTVISDNPGGNGIEAYISTDCTITGNAISGTCFVGIYPLVSPNVVVRGNTITGTMQRGMWPRWANNATITNNTITGEMWRAIQVQYTSNSVVSNNVIDRVISPPEHPWWNGAISVDECSNCTVQGNIICGKGRSSIHLWGTANSIVIGNDCSGYTANWGGDMIPREEKGLCQIYFGNHSNGNIVSGNIWGPVSPDGVAAVFVSQRGAPSSDLDIMDNDYTRCGVPGWASADGPGCVLLANGTQNSFVFESGNFPPGTGDARNQVVDLTRELTGSTTNRVVGHPANFLVGDMNPGIGQLLQEIMDQLDALPEPVEEEIEL